MTGLPFAKPKREPKVRKPLPRATTPLKRTPIARSTTPVKQRNEKRIAKKHAAYRTVISSSWHKRLRYLAYARSEGLCECTVCVAWRKAFRLGGEFRHDDAEAITLAHRQINVWFTTGGGSVSARFRSTEGELHHDSYRYFSKENPEELQHVRWVHTECHRRIESTLGTRRRYLSGRK